MKHMRILYFPLSLFPWQRDQDARNVRALSKCSWFTHVFLKLPAWQEVRDVLSISIVKRAIANIKEARKKIIWARSLWPSYLARADVEVTRKDLIRPTFYVQACERVRAEADAIGFQSGLETEPYNALKVALNAYLKSKISPAKRRLIHASAMAAEGMVDFITPCSSYRPWYYPYTFAGMGATWMTQNTYYLDYANDSIVTNPPDYVEEHRDIWGHAMSAKGRTINEVKTFDAKLLRARGFSGQFCWIPKKTLGKVIADPEWERRGA